MNFYKNPHGTSQTGENNKKIEDSKLGILFSNPIYNQKGTPQGSRTGANRLYGGYSSGLNAKNLSINYKQTLKIINEAFAQKTDLGQLFYVLHNILATNMQSNFSAIGLLNARSNCINVKLIDKIGSIYNTKIMLNDDSNPLIKCYLTKTVQSCQDNKFLKAVKLESNLSEPFYDIKIDIPSTFISNKNRINIAFKSHKGKMVGRIFGVRLIQTATL